MSIITNTSYVYLNGDFIKPEQAMISAFDRGFIFGDGIYEVLPVFGSRPFRLTQHLARLHRNLTEVRIDIKLSDQQLEKIFLKLIDLNDFGELSIYLQVTRGVAQRDHVFPDKTKATVFAYAQRAHYPDQNTVSKGVNAITIDDIRWSRCDIKTVALIANVMMRQQAFESEAAEAILIRDNQVTEGATSNIFIVKENKLLTPPEGPTILSGITRDLVIELANQFKIRCDTVTISRNDLLSADEVWMTNSTKEIMPIVSINNEKVGSGRPGQLFEKMHQIYCQYKEKFRLGQAG